MRLIATALAALLLPQAGLAADAASNFGVLVEREWQWRLREDPLYATAVGVHDYDDRLPSVTTCSRGFVPTSRTTRTSTRPQKR